MSCSPSAPRSKPDGLTVAAPAKVNLSLRVLGGRPDGYTEIRTLFQTVSLADRVTLRLTREPGIRLACDDPDLTRGPDNLAHRAAAAFLSHTGLGGGVDIKLAKRIPAAAGLGGGSSDAAAVLRGLNRLCGMPLNAAALHAAAASLGSDVPFFLIGGTALGRGRGEIVETLPDLPSLALVIVRPGMGVSTVEAYRMLAHNPGAPPLTGEGADISILLHCLRERDLTGAAPYLLNDLEPGVMRAHPEVRRAREALCEAGAAAVLMSGSGSSCFGLFKTVTGTAAARRSLAAGHPGWSVFSARFSPRMGHDG